MNDAPFMVGFKQTATQSIALRYEDLKKIAFTNRGSVVLDFYHHEAVTIRNSGQHLEPLYEALAGHRVSRVHCSGTGYNPSDPSAPRIFEIVISRGDLDAFS